MPVTPDARTTFKSAMTKVITQHLCGTAESVKAANSINNKDNNAHQNVNKGQMEILNRQSDSFNSIECCIT